jgi:serine/threonine-protein kinase
MKARPILTYVEEGRADVTPPQVKYSPGTVFDGKYRVERVLGCGGMGVVLAATHLKLDQPVAIKVVLPELAGNPEVVERFLREGRAAVKIRSEHVARVMDVESTEDGTPYMVMEYLEGSDLSQVVEKRGALPVTESVGHVLQACEAVAQAHALGIVHRDLKPANLFLTTGADGQPFIKVLDFGISKVGAGSPVSSDHKLTRTASMMGSPAYMAPEQMRSTRTVDARADVWAMGAILYELLLARPPFNGTTIADLLVTIIQDAHAPIHNTRAEVPPSLDAVVSRCLEKDPERRFPSMAELATALERFGPPWAHVSVARIQRTLSGVPRPRSSADIVLDPQALTPAPARTEGTWASAPTPAKKRPPVALVLAGGAAMLVAVAAAGVIAMGRRTPQVAKDQPSGANVASASDTPAPATAALASAPPQSVLAPGATESTERNAAPSNAAPPGSAGAPPAKVHSKTVSPPKTKKTTVDDRHG